MASPKLSRHRQSKAGAFYVVTAVAIRRSPLFANHAAARAVIGHIALCEHEGLVDSHAWVVMPDHIHWLLELRLGSLRSCLQRFKSRSAREINDIANADGSVWQPGYYDHYLRNEEDLRKQAEYIVANPVRAGIATTIDEYPYCWCRWVEIRSDVHA